MLFFRFHVLVLEFDIVVRRWRVWLLGLVIKLAEVDRIAAFGTVVQILVYSAAPCGIRFIAVDYVAAAFGAVEADELPEVVRCRRFSCRHHLQAFRICLSGNVERILGAAAIGVGWYFHAVTP